MGAVTNFKFGMVTRLLI